MIKSQVPAPSPPPLLVKQPAKPAPSGPNLGLTAVDGVTLHMLWNWNHGDTFVAFCRCLKFLRNFSSNTHVIMFCQIGVVLFTISTRRNHTGAQTEGCMTELLHTS